MGRPGTVGGTSRGACMKPDHLSSVRTLQFDLHRYGPGVSQKGKNGTIALTGGKNRGQPRAWLRTGPPVEKRSVLISELARVFIFRGGGCAPVGLAASSWAFSMEVGGS